MSVEIAWKQNILVTDFHLLKSLLVVFGFGSQAFVCGFSRQNINSVAEMKIKFLRGLIKILLLAYTANVLSAEIADECLQTKSTDNLQ